MRFDISAPDDEDGIAEETLFASTSLTSSRAPDFTVGSALRWLGHECADQRCYAPIDTLRAAVWFIRDTRRCRTFPLWTRVLADAPYTDDGMASILQVMHQVNGCTRRDAIEVRFQPGRVQNRRNPPAAHPVPLSPLMGVHPVEMPGPSDGDLHAIMANRW